MTATLVALSGLLGTGALAQTSDAVDDALSDLESEAAAVEAGLDADESRDVTSDDLYRNFKRRFESRGGARNFRIAVTPARGVTRPGRARCDADIDLPDGGVQVSCQDLNGPADVFLVDNQEVAGDSVLPESHDTLTRVGRIGAARGGTSRLSAQFGADFFADSEVDLIVLVEPGGDPTARNQLVALGGPSAFMRKYWRETRRGPHRPGRQVHPAAPWRLRDPFPASRSRPRRPRGRPARAPWPGRRGCPGRRRAVFPRRLRRQRPHLRHLPPRREQPGPRSGVRAKAAA